MLRKLLVPILVAVGFAACHAGASVGPVHAGGGVHSHM